MLTRTIALFTFGVAAILFGAAQTEAQPGKGPKGFKGPGSGPDVKKLESDLERLLAQVEETKAQLARAKEASGGKKFEGKGKGFGKGEFKKKDGKKEMAKQGFPPFGGKGKEGFGPMGKKGFAKKGFGKEGFGPGKLSPDMIKTKYEFYKKLYEESQRDARKGKGGPKGKGKGFEGKKKEMGERGFPPIGAKGKEGFRPKSDRGPDSVEARIDRLTRELDEIRKELKTKRR